MIDQHGICTVHPHVYGIQKAHGDSFTYSTDDFVPKLELYDSITDLDRTHLGCITTWNVNAIKSCGVFFLEHAEPRHKMFEICFSNGIIE